MVENSASFIKGLSCNDLNELDFIGKQVNRQRWMREGGKMAQNSIKKGNYSLQW